MQFRFHDVSYSVDKVLNREDHKNIIRKKIQSIRDNLIIKDSGMTVYTKSDIELSKGCQACKNGTWWCLHMGLDCNLRCKFCSQDKSPEAANKWNHPRSIMDYWIDDVKSYLDLFGRQLTGVSYSGGETLMYLPKVLEIAGHIKKTQKHIYQWIYTNGVHITEDVLRELKEVGISEIRVNLTATDFNDLVVGKLKIIRKIIGRATVEIVSVPETYKKLIEEKYIHRLVALGVQQLNLAELEMMQHVNWKNYAEDKEIYIHDTFDCEMYSPAGSRNITLSIIEYVILNKLNILVNDCSNDTKHLQRIMRKQAAPNILKY